ncbi:hypothetical protein H0H87_000904 [Tephrocybe sp. NHM501043]|nr:hypothetical protein H0H87_000904 [Tephrocybe sp. NHM501043]
MDAALSGPPTESNDVFSLSDQVLSDRLHFIEEIGFGNWGSVWLCKPKLRTGASKDGPEQKLAVKLVHRSKTSTTAARVRSLWNEMKIVKAFKSDPHPSIVPFHSFIITPSYALITMPFLPALVPVEVDEIKAREWPANILLSHNNIPVLVDFGFAEKYDMKSDIAFHSNLSYGTPEYLSPERARGLPHDTRKSDVWSLGVTFFEILIGRTPFENSDGEQFTTKEDLERYWSRTLRGKWVGEWRMSKGMERMLRRMIFPNADLRCTATQLMNDSYWAYRKESVASPASASHRRSTSYTSSIVFEKETLKVMESARPWTEQEVPDSPPGLDLSDLSRKSSMESSQIPQLVRPRSQPKIVVAKPPPCTPAPPRTPAPRKRVPVIGELSPVPVRDRVKEWEHERQRMREMERLEEIERERDEAMEMEMEKEEKQREREESREREREREREKIKEREREMGMAAAKQNEVAEKENYCSTQTALPTTPIPTPTTPVISSVASSFTSGKSHLFILRWA